jgi:metal-sulfur cluster biosynthetic enzyme
MAAVTEHQILGALGCIVDPDKKRDIVSLNMVKGLQVKDGHVVFAIEVDPERGPKMEPLRAQAEKTVHALPGVITVQAMLTAGRRHRRRRLRQGRRRQVDHRRQPRRCARHAGPARRPARCRHLRTLDAPHARHHRQPGLQ